MSLRELTKYLRLSSLSRCWFHSWLAILRHMASRIFRMMGDFWARVGGALVQPPLVYPITSEEICLP